MSLNNFLSDIGVLHQLTEQIGRNIYPRFTSRINFNWKHNILLMNFQGDGIVIISHEGRCSLDKDNFLDHGNVQHCNLVGSDLSLNHSKPIYVNPSNYTKNLYSQIIFSNNQLKSMVTSNMIQPPRSKARYAASTIT